jgi:CelD/BcsL family acetyltransferase involved in cellulose biosynthesis
VFVFIHPICERDSVRAELHTTPAVFDLLAGEWNSLLDPRRSDNLFTGWYWQRIWWEHLGRGTLCVVTIRDGEGALRGIGPWFVEETDGRRIVRFIGCEEVSDYLDFLLMPGHEEEALGALLDFMLSGEAPEWDSFELCNIPQDSMTLDLLPQLAEARGLTTEVIVADVCPVVPLEGTYEDYLAGLDKKQRHELRRKRRRAEGHPVDWYIVGQEHDLDAEIDRFLALMAMSTGEKADFLKQPGHRAFFREMGKVMFEQGRLELIFLTVGGSPAATMWQFTCGERTLLYNSGLNQADYAFLSPGIVLLTHSIEDAIRRGMKKYDFLRGDEAYKYRMGGVATTVHTIFIRR